MGDFPARLSGKMHECLNAQSNAIEKIEGSKCGDFFVSRLRGFPLAGTAIATLIVDVAQAALESLAQLFLLLPSGITYLLSKCFKKLDWHDKVENLRNDIKPMKTWLYTFKSVGAVAGCWLAPIDPSLYRLWLETLNLLKKGPNNPDTAVAAPFNLPPSAKGVSGGGDSTPSSNGSSASASPSVTSGATNTPVQQQVSAV